MNKVAQNAVKTKLRFLGNSFSTPSNPRHMEIAHKIKEAERQVDPWNGNNLIHALVACVEILTEEVQKSQ